jgi:MscS family membrane protein
LRDFRAAAGAGRWAEAAAFLRLDSQSDSRGPELAQRLNAVIETIYELDPDSLSGAATGRLDDGLPPDVEEIGQVEHNGHKEPIRMVRDARGATEPWTFSSTPERIDSWYGGLHSHWVRERIAAAGLSPLLREGPWNIFYWQWLAFPLIALVAWAFGRAAHALLRPLIAHLTRRTPASWDDRVIAGVGPPLTLAFAMLVFTVGVILTDLNREAFLVVRSLVRLSLTFVIIWTIWRVWAVFLAWSMSRTWALQNPSMRNLLSIGTNLSRAVIVGLGGVAMFAAAGFEVGAALAGLGIGGLALAFGAQKTVENLFGSVALAIDQPIRVGDLVKVQDFVGTVEDIGIRSTRFRTLDRTIVSIPNGKLADERLESLAVRDRLRLALTLGLVYGTTRAQVDQVLADVETILRSHPKIWADGITVKFFGLGSSSLDIEVSAWFDVADWRLFQVYRQDVLLAILEVVERAGTSLAFPTQTVHLVGAAEPATASDRLR